MTTVSWPPTVDDLKLDLREEAQPVDERDDERLQQALDAAVEFVQRVRPRFAFDSALPGSGLPVPPADLVLGTLRYAGRLHTRRRSPDGLVQMGDLGAGRVSTGDPDIDRLLRIGRHQVPRVG